MTTTKTEVIIQDAFESGPKVLFHHRVGADIQASFAMQCIEKWAMVAAETDGEDTSGRQKLRRLTPDEIVSAACEVSAKAFAKFRELGWLVDVPSYDDAKAEARRKDDDRMNEAKKKNR